MLSEEEAIKRMNVIKARIVHHLDQGEMHGGPISAFTYILELDEMVAKWFRLNMAGRDTSPNRECYERMSVMSRLYLELYDQLDSNSKKLWDGMQEEKLKSQVLELKRVSNASGSATDPSFKGNRFCSGCGKVLEYAAQDKEIVQSEMTTSTCPKCGQTQSREASECFCAKCGEYWPEWTPSTPDMP